MKKKMKISAAWRKIMAAYRRMSGEKCKYGEEAANDIEEECQ